MEIFCQGDLPEPQGDDILNAADARRSQLDKSLVELERAIVLGKEVRTLTPITLAELTGRHDEMRGELAHYHRHLGSGRLEPLWKKRLYNHQRQHYQLLNQSGPQLA